MNFPWRKKKSFIDKWDENRNRLPSHIPKWGYLLIMFIFFAGLVKVMEWSIILVINIIERII